MRIDKYGEQASFNMGGNSSFSSVHGTLISILVLAIVIPYGVNKYLVMKDRDDTNFESITIENAFDSRQRFTHE